VADDITIRPTVDDDWGAFYESLAGSFNDDPDDDWAAVELLVFEPERSLVAQRGDEVVGTAGIYTRRLSVPGATVPAAHVTLISVAPTARRQGVLTRFINRQFADMQAAGEPIAVLWASEGRIYQRFGYGLSARKLNLTVDTRETRLLAPSADEGRIRQGKPADLRETLVKVYDQAYASRPGWSERASRHWDNRLADPKVVRRDASALRAVVHEGAGGVDGYALWRVANKWDDGGPAGEVRVGELIANSTEAYLGLWRFLLSVDLTRTTTAWSCALDEPLMFLVNEPRKLGGRLGDALWLRIIDVPAALAARRYASPVDVVIEVTDDLIPGNAGRWRLTGSAEQATCVASTDAADLACDIRSLGAAYLGDAVLPALAAGGLVRELRPGALAAASAAFGWHRPPSVGEVF